MFAKVFVVTIVLSVYTMAADFAVVMNTHSPITQLSKRQLQDIFLVKKRFYKDMKLIPVNSSAFSEIRINFEKSVLHKSRNKLNKYWVKKHFQGIQPPIVQTSSKAVKLFVKNVDGAIGYIPIQLLDTDLKVLYEF